MPDPKPPDYAGQNINALLGEMKYSVARFVAALGGEIPQPRIESWIKEKGAPKTTDTKILCDFFKISSESLHKHLFSPKEIESIIKSRNLLTQGQAQKETQVSQDSNEVFHLKDKISMLERMLTYQDRALQYQDKLIEELQRKKIPDGVQHNGGA